MNASFWHRTRRRPSFWLGLFLACFFAWAWWDSYRYTVAAYYNSNAGHFVFGREDGVSLVSVSRALVVPWEYSSGDWSRFPAELREGRIEAMVEEYCEDHWKVPDSLVFFSFVGVWVGWLAWRWRVEQKTLTA